MSAVLDDKTKMLQTFGKLPLVELKKKSVRILLGSHSTLKRRAGYISFDPPSVQLLRLVHKIEFAPLYQSMKTKDQKLAEIKGLARRAAQRFFSVFIFLQFGGKNLLKKLCQ